MNKLSKIVSVILITIFALSTFTFTSASAAEKKILGGKTLKTYVDSTKNDTPVYKTSKATDTKKIGTIYASDLITISKVSDTYPYRLYVTYPVTGTNKTKSGWIDSEAIIFIGGDWSDELCNPDFGYIAKKKITTYRRMGSKSTSGYISKGDKVSVITSWLRDLNYDIEVPVIYPISGGYKMGWIKSSDYEKNLK